MPVRKPNMLRLTARKSLDGQTLMFASVGFLNLLTYQSFFPQPVLQDKRDVVNINLDTLFKAI
jgi:hypothetical protein